MKRFSLLLILIAASAFGATTKLRLETQTQGILPSANGGTGINNSTRTLTLSTNSGTIAFPSASTVQTFPTTSQTLAGLTEAQTMTNKRITKRQLNAPAPGPTPAINTDNYDQVHITNLGGNISSFTTSLSGTPAVGDRLAIDITDNGTPRTISWGASFESSPGETLPATTVASTRLDIIFVWNEDTSKWRCVGSSDVSNAGASDIAFSSLWNGITVVAPSKNALYDYLHLSDTNDDGKTNVLDQVAGITNTDASGVIQTPIASSGTGAVLRVSGASANTFTLSQSANTNLLAPGSTAVYGKRFTNSSPVGHLLLLMNSDETTALFDVDVTGTLNTGIIPVARIDYGDPGAHTIRVFDNTLNQMRNATIGANLTYTQATNTLSATGGSGSPGGSDTQVQFNDSTAFGGDAGLTYNKTTDALTVGGAITSGGVAVPTISSTSTLTNKNVVPRTRSTTSATSWTPDFDTYDQEEQTALAGDITAVNAPTFTGATNGSKRILRIKNNATPHNIGGWNSIYVVMGTTLPLTIGASKTIYIGLIYNGNTSKWDVVAVAVEA